MEGGLRRVTNHPRCKVGQFIREGCEDPRWATSPPPPPPGEPLPIPPTTPGAPSSPSMEPTAGKRAVAATAAGPGRGCRR